MTQHNFLSYREWERDSRRQLAIWELCIIQISIFHCQLAPSAIIHSSHIITSHILLAISVSRLVRVLGDPVLLLLIKLHSLVITYGQSVLIVFTPYFDVLCLKSGRLWSGISPLLNSIHETRVRIRTRLQLSIPYRSNSPARWSRKSTHAAHITWIYHTWKKELFLHWKKLWVPALTVRARDHCKEFFFTFPSESEVFFPEIEYDELSLNLAASRFVPQER